MKKSTLLLGTLAIACSAYAGDKPVIGQADPRQPSGYFPEIMEANGVKTEVTVHNFGTEDFTKAENYGRRLAPTAYRNEVAFDEMVTREGMKLYNDPYFAHCFDVVAKNAYRTEMRRELGIK